MIIWDSGLGSNFIYSDAIKEVEKLPGAPSKRIAVGDRVARGPDWKPMRNEDSHGQGTVVNVDFFVRQSGVQVLWDNGTSKAYDWNCE